MKYPHVINHFSAAPWAILPEKLYAMMQLIELRATGFVLTQGEIDSRIGRPDAGPGEVQAPSGIAVLPIMGTIAHRMSLLKEASGGTSVQRLTSDFRAALRNPDVAAIVLDIDSPGGSTSGIEEVADEIYNGRPQKRIIASVNSLAASAAYWIASSAHEIAVTPSGHVGSIGVLGVHVDMSEKAKAEGIKVSVVSAGKYKAEGSEFAPLDEEARSHLQGLVDDRYDAFVRAVARGRGVPLKAVRDGFGEGRLVSAREGLSAGMVDSIETADQVISRTIGRAARARKIADAASWELELAGEADVIVAAAEELQAQERRGFVMQTLVAPKAKWSSLDDARAWVKGHGFRADKVDDTPNAWRFRQRDPGDFARIRPTCVNPGRLTPPTFDRCKIVGFGGPLKAGATAQAPQDCPAGQDCPMKGDMAYCPKGDNCPSGMGARAAQAGGFDAYDPDVDEWLTAGVIPSNVSETIAPEGTPWSAPALKDFTSKSWNELTDAEKRRIAMHAAWADAMPPSSFGGIKLFHHRPSDGAIVPNGVRNALARLNQTQGLGSDRPRVEAHLRAHMDAIQARRQKAIADPKLDPRKRLVELMGLE